MLGLLAFPCSYLYGLFDIAMTILSLDILITKILYCHLYFIRTLIMSVHWCTAKFSAANMQYVSKAKSKREILSGA